MVSVKMDYNEFGSLNWVLKMDYYKYCSLNGLYPTQYFKKLHAQKLLTKPRGKNKRNISH